MKSHKRKFLTLNLIPMELIDNRLIMYLDQIFDKKNIYLNQIIELSFNIYYLFEFILNPSN